MSYLNPIVDQHPDPIHVNARLDAKANNQQFYHGRICNHDGTTQRYVRDDFCVLCAKRMRVREFGVQTQNASI